MKIVNIERKRFVDKLADECDENIDEEVKILEIMKMNVILEYYILYCFQNSLQLML